MARYENKKMDRFTDGDTDIFKTKRLEFDLSKMRFLHCGVDTIRQLYNCSLNMDILKILDGHFDKTSSDIIEIGDIEWKFKKGGKQGGYQYILKNLNIGFIVLLKSFYVDANERGGHIKIEASPEIIDRLGLSRLTKEFRDIASIFGNTLEASGIAVHLAIDIKGLDIPEDFEESLVCHSKRSYKVNGISDISIDGAAVAMKYNRGETYLFGRSSGLQLCLYDKSIEALKSDKLQFWESVWKRTPAAEIERFPEPEYHDGFSTGVSDTVHRLEFRIHQRIISEFENGNFNATGHNRCIRESVDLICHLDSLLQYCLNNFRLQYSSTYIHPIWQKISEDVTVYSNEKWDDSFVYKRSPKKSDKGPSRRNVGLWLGNFLTLAVRRGLTEQECIDAVMTSGLIDDLFDYFGVLKYHESADELPYKVADFIREKHRLKQLDGLGAAA
jgi:hypothetical protein